MADYVRDVGGPPVPAGGLGASSEVVRDGDRMGALARTTMPKNAETRSREAVT